MFSLGTLTFSEVSAFISNNAETLVLIVLGAVICFFFKNTKQISENYTPSYKWAVISGILLCLSLFNMSGVSNFLYFDF